MPHSLELIKVKKEFPLPVLTRILNCFSGTDQRKIVFNDINIKFKQGEIIGIIGTNGSGKTTLLKIIAGIILPTSGEIRLDDSTTQTSYSRRSKKTGLMGPNENSFYLRLTGRQNLLFFGRMYGSYKNNLSNIITNIIENFQLKEFIDRPVNLYSSGMRQKLNLARSVLNQPEILLLDEPFKSLDRENKNFVFLFAKQYIKENQNRTVIIASHLQDFVEKLCSSSFTFKDGCLYKV